MREVEHFFQREAPFQLFHYTGIGAVLGMERTRTAWASHAYYLNDSQEVLYACNILDEELMPRLVFGEPSSCEVKFLSQLSKWVKSFHTASYNIFIFSLSQEKSLLSQWRSYTPHGKGVSLGFSPLVINKTLHNSRAVLAKCLYDRDDQGEILRSLIDKILITFRQRKQTIDISLEHPDSLYFKFLEEFRDDFLKVLCVIKHPAFEEEKEWRLISPYYPSYVVPAIKFREGASMLVPYVEFPFPSIEQVFETVILGPSQHQNLSMSALGMYLRNRKLCSTIENCTIPYREW